MEQTGPLFSGASCMESVMLSPECSKTVGEYARGDSMGSHFSVCKYHLDFFPGRFYFTGVYVYQKNPRLQNLNVRGPFADLPVKEFHLIYSHIPVLNKVMASIRGIDALIMLAGMLFLCLNFKNNQEMKFRPTVSMAVFTVFCMGMGNFLPFQVCPEFLYFNF